MCGILVGIMDWQLPRASRFSNLNVLSYVYYPCVRMCAFVKLELGLGNRLCSTYLLADILFHADQHISLLLVMGFSRHSSFPVGWIATYVMSRFSDHPEIWWVGMKTVGGIRLGERNS